MRPRRRQPICGDLRALERRRRLEPTATTPRAGKPHEPRDGSDAGLRTTDAAGLQAADDGLEVQVAGELAVSAVQPNTGGVGAVVRQGYAWAGIVGQGGGPCVGANPASR